MNLEVVVIRVSDVDRAKQSQPGQPRLGRARSSPGLYLIVSNIEAGRDELVNGPEAAA